ncbi:MAG: hypothetical protein HYV40_03520 [Candidatus Levybacteria bacterium]|nr:hypothetical protein [Candidatus Levybacteria bacterium]
MGKTDFPPPPGRAVAPWEKPISEQHPEKLSKSLRNMQQHVEAIAAEKGITVEGSFRRIQRFPFRSRDVERIHESVVIWRFEPLAK